MNKKWIINNNKILSPSKRKKYWENVHTNEMYESVWSMTDDEEVRNKIINEIRNYDNISKVIIPGCGSKVFLQNDISEKITNINEIICTDYEAVINIASKNNKSKIISYVDRDSTNLNYYNKFDASIIVNSILSEDDVQNRSMISSCYDSLKNEGMLIGFFPTIFCALDIANINKSDWLKQINISKSSFYEKEQNIWQIFYTPLRLRMILKEAGFTLEKMELFFCDSPYFVEHSKKYYNLADQDIVIYELFIVAKKIV